MTEAVSISETPVYFETTQCYTGRSTHSETSTYVNETTPRYIPEGYYIHTRSRENLKYHIDKDLVNILYIQVANTGEMLYIVFTDRGKDDCVLFKRSHTQNANFKVNTL
jgi:hypothetical protein